MEQSASLIISSLSHQLWNSYLAIENFAVSLLGSNLINGVTRSIGTLAGGETYLCSTYYETDFLNEA